MSWTLSLTNVAADDVDNALAQRLTEFDHSAEGVDDQIEEAKQAVQNLIDSGAVGDGPYTISMNGHAKQSEGENHSIGLYVSGP